MRIFKKITALLLALVLCASLCLPAFAEDDGKKLNYLVLGDSIAYGYGIMNSENAVYGKIVADTNGYNYNNEAYGDGETTASLLEKVTEKDYIREFIEDADIISISIGANDYFLDENTGLDEERILKVSARLLFLGDDSALDEIEARANANYNKIMDTIYELNPDVTIVAQTFYKSWYGILGIVYKNVINRANGVVKSYKEQNPDRKYLIADVYSAFKCHKNYVTADTIHPSAKGNLAIAQTVLNTLYDAGLGTSTEPVVNEPGLDYNYWFRKTSPDDAFLKYFLIRLVTGRLFVF